MSAKLPEILPCPFCGSSASLEETPSGLRSEIVSFSVGCDSSDEAYCYGYQSLTVFASRRDAILAWNKRSPMPDLRTADEWLAQPKYKGIEVLDPDGWDRTNFAESWAERISEGEFNRRLSVSTCRWPINKLKDLRHE